MNLFGKSVLTDTTQSDGAVSQVDYSYLLGHREQNERHNPQVQAQAEKPHIDLREVSELLRSAPPPQVDES